MQMHSRQIVDTEGVAVTNSTQNLLECFVQDELVDEAATVAQSTEDVVVSCGPSTRKSQAITSAQPPGYRASRSRRDAASLSSPCASVIERALMMHDVAVVVRETTVIVGSGELVTSPVREW